MKVSIAIPVFNEEKTIALIIKKVKNLKIDKEIIVIDDGSTDSSFDKVKNIKGIILIKHDKNLGKGAAIKSALKIAKGNIFIIQDADLELDPEQIPKVISPIITGKAQVVYGSRNLIKVKDKNRRLAFYLGSKLITILTNILYGTKITDEPCGYKAFDISLLKGINLENNRFEFEPEITAKIAKKGINILEVPVISKSRTIKEGKKIRLSDGFKAIFTLLKYKIK